MGMSNNDIIQSQVMFYWDNLNLTPDFNIIKFFQDIGGYVTSNPVLEHKVYSIEDYEDSGFSVGPNRYEFVANLNNMYLITIDEKFEIFKSFYQFYRGRNVDSTDCIKFAIALNLPKKIFFEEVASLYENNPGKETTREIGQLNREEVKYFCEAYHLDYDWMQSTLDYYLGDDLKSLKSWYAEKLAAEEVVAEEIMESIIDIVYSSFDTKFPSPGPRVRNLAKRLKISMADNQNETILVLGKICDYMLSGNSNEKEREFFTKKILDKLKEEKATS